MLSCFYVSMISPDVLLQSPVKNPTDQTTALTPWGQCCWCTPPSSWLLGDSVVSPTCWSLATWGNPSQWPALGKPGARVFHVFLWPIQWVPISTKDFVNPYHSLPIWALPFTMETWLFKEPGNFHVNKLGRQFWGYLGTSILDVDISLMYYAWGKLLKTFRLNPRLRFEHGPTHDTNPMFEHVW